MTDLQRTFCRNCAAACGLLIKSDGQRIVSIRGDRDHPLTSGYMCIKGRLSGDWHNGEDRLTTSLKRISAGQFSPVTSTGAVDEIHARLSGILEEHGPASVAVYFGTGAKTNAVGVLAMRSWLRMMGSPNLFSSSTIDQSAKWVTAGRLGVFLTGKPSIRESDVVMMVGMNPLVSHTGVPALPSNNPQRWLREARKRGSKLIVVDPRRTETARYADMHIQVKPGGDIALFAGIIKLILDNQWHDQAFCARFATSMDRLTQAIAHFTPASAAAHAGVPLEQLEEAARLFALAKTRTAVSGTGPNMSLHSNLAEHLIEVLNAICGAYRRCGDVIHNPGALLRTTRACEGVRPPQRLWESAPKLKIQDAGLVMGEFPTALLPAEIANSSPQRIRALIVYGGNPATAVCDGKSMRESLKNLELLVTIDPRMTDTARLSHYILSTKLPYERHDISYQFENFTSAPFVQVTRPIIAAPPDMLDDWEIFFELAKRMKRNLTLSPDPAFGPRRGNQSGLDLLHTAQPQTTDIIRWLCENASLSYESLADHPEGIMLECEPVVIAAAAADDGARLDLCPPDVAQELADYQSAPVDQTYPYSLVVRRMIETMNSAFRDATGTRERFPVNPAFIHPDDMKAEGIDEGGAIEIQSRHGTIVGHARTDASMRRGVISMSHQWGKLDAAEDPMGLCGSFTGRLVSLTEERETINFMPRQSGIPIRIKAIAK